MYSLLVDDSSDHKKSKGVNRIIVEKITMNKHVLSNQNVWVIWWIESTVKSWNRNLKKIKKILYCALVIEHTFKTMDMRD